ncbi:MAG: hypothetical protein ACI4RA_08915, partial [Kiritimatiellia bacterium]
LVACACARAGDFVTYEEFGAVGDGKTDDQAAIVKAHAAANARGVPVRAGDGRTYYIGPGTTSAVVKTDVDFGTAKFIIDDSKVTAANRHHAIFAISPSRAAHGVTGVATLARGQANIGVKLDAPSLVVVKNHKKKRYIRFGANQNNGSAQEEVILVGADGAVDPRAPIVWDFEQVTGMTAHPVDARPLVIRGGVFTTIANQAESKYTYYGRNFTIRRSNVRIEGLRHEVTGELDHGAPYGGFLAISQCADVTVTGCVFTAHKTYVTIGSAGVPVSMGSYDLSVNAAVNVSFIDCRQTTDIRDRAYWGLLGSNYCKNLLYDGCTFSRFDAHMGVANATIRNSTLGYMGINAIGFGTFTVENSTVCGGTFFNLRGDYGSTWEGEFIVRNCTFRPACGRPATGSLIGGQYTGKHDFGYVCHMPRRIVFDGLRIDDSNHPRAYDGPFIFANFNKANTSADYVETYPYQLTEEVVLKNVTTASGKPLRLSPNPHMFRNVKVTRD